MTGGPANLDFEGGSDQDGRPRHWGGGGEGYQLLVDGSVSRVGGASGCVRSVGQAGPEGFGTLTQCFAADPYLGRRVRYWGFLKTADVRGWAGLWMRVDGSPGEILRFDNMSTPVDRSVSGTTGWTQYEIVLDVPPEAMNICLGFLLAGTGTVWGDDLRVEILDTAAGSSDAEAALPLPGGLLPAWASGGYGHQPGRTAGMAGDGGSAAQDLFFGRDDELLEFRDLLAELARNPKKAPAGWSHVVIVHGIGGIGKSTLAARFCRIAAEGDNHDRYTIVNVDWADVREDPAFAAQPAPSFEAVLERLEQECAGDGKLIRHFEQFRRLLLRIAKVNADVDRMGGGLADSDQPGTAAGRSVKMVGSALQAAEAFGLPPGPGEALQAAGVAVDAASAVWKGSQSWLRSRLDPDDYQLYVHPEDVLAAAFAKGLAAAAVRCPIVLMLDTCEVVTGAGRWLRAVMRQSGPRVVWVLCGRFEADPAGWPDHIDLSDGYVPGGRLSELNAYRKEVPGTRLRLFELAAFDAATLIAYLRKAAPQRPADEAQLTRLLAATAGIPLAVRLAASLWRRGIAIETITDPVPVGTDRRTVVEAMTERFFLHFSGDPTSRSDRDRIYGLALVLYDRDADLIAALWNTDHVDEAFESLARRHDFVLAGQFRLHDAVQAFLLRYLLDPFRRRGVRPVNQRAVAVLEQRLSLHHQHLSTLEQRMRDERWILDLLALVWHRFWVDDQDGWATVLAAFPAVIAYNRDVGRAMLDLAGRFIPSSAADGQRRLRLLRDALGPVAALFDPAGADSLSEMERSGHRASVEPDEGCDDERAAIMDWLSGEHTLHNNELAAALQHLTAAADRVPPSARQLRRWIGRSLLTVSGDLVAELSVVPPAAEIEPYAAAARLAARLDPDDPYTQRKCGVIFTYLGRNEDALGAFGAAIELGDHSADAYLDRAVILGELGRHHEALDAANQALSLQSDNAEAAAIRGAIYHRIGHYDEAMADLGDAINRDDGLARAFISRGTIYLERGDNEKALADFGRAIELIPGSASAITDRGRIYRMMGQYEKALDDLNEALRLAPGYTFALTNRGEVHRMMGQYEKAVTDFSRAIEVDPAYATAVACRGQAYQDMGQHEKAVTDLDRAIELDPDPAWAIGTRGQTYRMMGQYEKALDDLNEALRLDPRLNWAILERGNTYQVMGWYEDALSDVSHLIELGEDAPSLLMMRGGVYGDMRRFDEALPDFSHAIDLDPDDRVVFAYRAMAYCLMGRHDDALADINKVIDSYPDWGWALTIRGRTFSEMGQYTEALTDLSRAARLDAEYAWPQFELAIASLRMKRRDPALTALTKAINLGTGRIAACGVTLPRIFDLALSHAAIGNAEQGKDLLVQALALPRAATYVRCTVIPELCRLQAAIPDRNQFDGLLQLLRTHSPTV
jgi:tetratricopeptide (TPR) repeat protein